MSTYSTADLTPLIALAEAHAAADELITGTYGKETSDGRYRGCSIGCTIYDAQQLGLIDSSVQYDDHQAVADLLYDGHEWVARLQDHLHETLPETERAQWTPRLLRAVIGYRIDWQRVYHRWSAALLRRAAEVADPDGVVSRVASLHESAVGGRLVEEREWSAARDAASIATWAVARDAAARDAARDARAAASAAAHTHQADALIAAIEAERR